MFGDAGLIVLCAFISPFSAMREFAREKAGDGRFMEVYVKADLDTCAKRDPKGLYGKGISNFTGISSPYEEPVAPDIILDTSLMSADECAEMVYLKVLEMLA
jgi:adenylylsulfate kinase